MAERRLSDGTSQSGDGAWRRRAFRIIFLSDTPAGRAFDLLLIVAVSVSVAVVMLASVPEYYERHGPLLRAAEWGFTLLFTAEYVLRLWCVHRPVQYARSFFGVIDLLAILPTWLELVLTGAGSLLVVRVLRLLRVFRVLKLSRYVDASSVLVQAMRQSLDKILVFLFAITSFVVIFGAAIYLIEAPGGNVRHIPEAVYWAVVTLTTVGYGDIVPQTAAGKALATVVMVLGYGIIAVPTGIYAAEIREVVTRKRQRTSCRECGRAGHEQDARFCRFCSAKLPKEGEEES